MPQQEPSLDPTRPTPDKRPFGSPVPESPVTTSDFKQLERQVQNLAQVVGGLFAGGLSILSGNGAPTMAQTAGCIYIRLNGSVNTRIYVCNGGTTWNAIAGV